MSDTISIDLSGVYRAIDVVNGNIGVVSKQVRNVIDNQEVINNNVEKVRQQTMAEINKIRNQLIEMDRRQRMAAALQRALTEIIRVRQELEAKFGNHKLVRDNMLGILQATDLALITKTTISKCTEELMISAPKYWLAPCLIALAAWISDNKTLANRAIKEAIRRDEEKTCLLFALITRRVNAGRIAEGKPGTNVCFKWLERYFSLQNPLKMRSSIVSYVDAYTNGVFGNDSDNLCGEHIAHWMDILVQKDPDFAKHQKEWWVNVFRNECLAPNTKEFKALETLANKNQYAAITGYISKIVGTWGTDGEDKDVIAKITTNSSKGIKPTIQDIVIAQPNTEALINAIDDQLFKLVSEYEEDEVELREEEQYLQFVKKYEGDEARAKNSMKILADRRRDDPVDFAKRLSRSIVDPNAGTSAKKTALVLLAPYISEAFNEFIVASKDSYPTKIDLSIQEKGSVPFGKSFQWTGATENGSNAAELVASLEKQYDEMKAYTISTITDDEAKKKVKTGTIVAATLFWTIIGLFVGLSIRKKGKNMLRENESNRAALAAYYDKAKIQNTALLRDALAAKGTADGLVSDFLSHNDSEEIKIAPGEEPVLEEVPASEEPEAKEE